MTNMLELEKRCSMDRAEPPRFATVNRWMAYGFALSPDQSALSFQGVEVGYRELDALSNRIANYLIGHGVRHGDCVGMCLDRSSEMVAVLIGILKAGAAYVPLDPAYPSDRLSMMVEDARLHCLLSHARHARLFDQAMVWENIIDEIAAESPAPSGVEVGPESVAYVIFTSGSTGRPKGVAMPHRALANLIEWQLERDTFKPGARVLQYTSISFDVSFQEMITTLVSGGTLYLMGNEDRRDPRKLLRQLVDQRIERLFLPYVAMRSMIEAAHMIETYPVFLKETITAGEQLRVDDPVRAFFKKMEGASLDNQYGPSETHVITAQLLEGNPDDWPDLPSIGTPLKNCGAFILDGNMKPVADGETGELYLAGRNLAQGYIHREDLTKNVFIRNPLDESGTSLLYKTGDLASYNPDGTIAFLGRRDHQIKVRGHRVEPGEINNAVSAFPGIGQCLTHLIGEAGGVSQLATYYTDKSGAGIDGSALREHLEKKLPEYMVPAFLIEISGVPYTPSGKVDLKALPKPSVGNSLYADEEVRYNTDIEKGLAVIWSELLGLDGIPSSADFFELGGDSLRAVTLFLRIQQQFDVDLPLSTLLQSSTLGALARQIADKGENSDFSGCRSLRLIQRGADGVVPIFLVHGGDGQVLLFGEFAKNLGADQPVYGFQWTGLDGGRGEASVRKMAEAYTRELLEHFPEGSIRMGGYCLGGLIAIEMVHLLRNTGVEVLEPLIVIDSPNLQAKAYTPRSPCATRSAMAEFERVRAELARQNILKDTRIHSVYVPQDAPSGAIGWLKRSYPYSLVREARTHARLKKLSKQALKGNTVPYSSRGWYGGQTAVKAARNHKSRGFKGAVLYLRSGLCHGAEMLLSGWWTSLYLGFDELCEGEFDGHVLGGGHDEILKRPEVAEIVKKAIEN